MPRDLPAALGGDCAFGLRAARRLAHASEHSSPHRSARADASDRQQRARDHGAVVTARLRGTGQGNGHDCLLYSEVGCAEAAPARVRHATLSERG
jgi:hypothetical protein